jgi:hypothetical protein
MICFFCRHCLWIICEGANLLDSGGTWEIIYKNANERGTCAKLTSNRISRAMKMLELNDQKRATTTNSSFTGNIMQKVHSSISTWIFLRYFDCKVTFQSLNSNAHI